MCFLLYRFVSFGDFGIFLVGLLSCVGYGCFLLGCDADLMLYFDSGVFLF